MDKLLIHEEWIDDIVLLKIDGLVDSGTSQLMEDKFNELIARGHVKIVADLEKVDYISSAGWGIFVGEIKGIRKKNGDIKLARMRPDVREVFDLLEFNALLTPYNSRDEAVAAFNEQENKELT
ncbi:MAG: STAS domain-containing protein [Candidatus Krumholzibacteria bacterium]|jgi:anti-sigma B factor antagonist|nr:STAS domain-containing protein [Candidatus Krumholzibacteria bacterium]